MNTFWNIYKGLEKELLKIADVITIDNSQSTVYSVKIAELLLRAAIEIEAISKRLYQSNGGEKSTDEAYFDEDCIALLNVKWRIEHRAVTISSPYIYLSDEYRTFSPLKNCSKRGEGTWKKAYQDVKHDREGNLNQASVLNFIKALGALYLLNLYYQSDSIDVGRDPFSSFDCTRGSDIFSVDVDRQTQYADDGKAMCGENLDKCTYIIRAKPGTLARVHQAIESINGEIANRAKQQLYAMIDRGEVVTKDVIDRTFQYLMIPTAQANYNLLHAATQGLRYEAILNKMRTNPVA